MKLSKLLGILVHFPAPCGAAVMGYALACGQPAITSQNEYVMLAAGVALLFAGGLKLAEFLPADVPTDTPVKMGAEAPSSDKEKSLVHHYSLQLQKALFTASKPRSSKWPTVRRKHLSEHPICAGCGRTEDELPSDSKIEVHHIKPFHLFPELELDPTNLVTLCECPDCEDHLDDGHTYEGKSSWSINNPDVLETAAKELAARGK
jgi:hypothetical protein